MVVPERMTQRQEVRTALAAQFWELPVSSARSLGDGAALALPCEPAPLAALAPQGAVRAQQLLAMQAGVGPLTPGYDGSNGGVVRGVKFLSFPLVLFSCCLFSSVFLKNTHDASKTSFFLQFVDRTLGCVGGRRWWAAMLGRARIQRLWATHARGVPLVSRNRVFFPFVLSFLPLSLSPLSL